MKKLFGILLDADSLFGRLILGIIYSLIYDFIYENFIYHYFYYLGLDYIEMSLGTRILWLTLSVLPLIRYRGINNVSAFFCLFLYVFVYVPFIDALFVTWGLSLKEILAYSSVMCISFLIYFGMGQKGSIQLFKNIKINPPIPIKAIEITTLLITLLFIVLRGKSMHFVNIFTQVDALYYLREKNLEDLGAMGFIVYLQGWLFGAFYPFLLVYYLKNKQRIKTALIILGYFSLFMVDMQKITFFMPLFLIGLYYLVKVKEKVICNRLHSFLFIIICIVSVILYITKDNEIVFAIGSLIMLRTTCVSGWLSQLYIHFFTNNPYTYYSHINIVNAITNSYPYSEPLGVVVAGGTQNANANFFLTDGLAADGILGVIFICILFLIILQVINSLSYRYKRTDLFIVFLPTLSYLLNTSLFTTLLSNGLFVLILILLCVDNSVEEKHIPNTNMTDDAEDMNKYENKSTSNNGK
jgi:hypothetical protein